MATEIMQLSWTHLSFAQHGFVPVQTRIAIFILPQMHYTLLALAFRVTIQQYPSQNTCISRGKVLICRVQGEVLISAL